MVINILFKNLRVLYYMIYYKYDEFGYLLCISVLNYIGKMWYIYNYI